MVKREEVEPHIVFVDTNILWDKDKKFPVDPNFDNFWHKNSSICSLELHIPEIVFGELHFQQTTSALKAMNQASESLKLMSDIAATIYKHRATEQKLKQKIEEKLQNWIRPIRAIIDVVPIGNINWSDIITSSLWRKPPFEFDPKNDENEKGFRDALIQETIVNYCLNNKKKSNIAFICNDKLLRNSTEIRLNNDQRFSVYPKLEDFESYLKLRHEELTNDFVKSILRKAKTKFFKKNDLECLYYKEKIRDRLKDDYSSYFADLTISQSEWEIITIGSTWDALDNGRFWINAARYDRTENENEFHWTNEITYIQQYQEKYMNIFRSPALRIGMDSDIESGTTWSTGMSSFNLPTEQRILKLVFHVNWRAKVTKHAQFREIQLTEIILSNNEFRVATINEINEYDLEINPRVSLPTEEI